MLKGKQGRFRQNLLGKRVDYSGRSVIVVGPELNLYECGLPKDMAVELFKPFIIRKLVEKNYVKTVKSAKKLVDKKGKEVWDILENIIDDHPVMLNRAPTLHRLGIQAFQPKLVEGKAIKIHPLVCSAFNADFDGDQMAVHVPLSFEAQAETRLLMLASHNILSPSNGNPVSVPSQDIVLGCYFLTKSKNGCKGEGKMFSDMNEVMLAYDLDKVDLHAKIKVRIDGKIVDTTVGRVIFYQIFPKEIPFENRLMNKKRIQEIVSSCFRKLGILETAKFLDKLKEYGFYYATKGGLSIGMEDMLIPEEKRNIVQDAQDEVDDINEKRLRGILTEGERYNKIIDIWTQVTNDVSDILFSRLEKDRQGFNPIFMMADSGARGSREQIRQLAGMRGLMQKPQKTLTGQTGEIIESPITANFKEGLSVLEYFISTHGARKGLADTALKTADAGYLTRRLVDVSQDVIISGDDCGTIMGIEMSALKEGEEVIEPLSERILGRVAVDDIVDPATDEIIVEAGEEIDEEKAMEISKTSIEKVTIRSVLTCEMKRGVCTKCYGRNLATSKLVDTGESVGIIAAQSIGEPGTQLTLRTFHIGGTAQRFAAQSQAESSIDGIIKLYDVKSVEREGDILIALGRHGRIEIIDEDERTLANYNIPYGAQIFVKEDQKVNKGDVLFQWDPYSLVILSDKKGVVSFVDIKEDITIREELDEQSGRKQSVIIESRNRNIHPIINIVDEKEEKLGSYILPTGSIMMIKDKDEVDAGDVLVKIPRAITKTRDITGGLPRVAELFEARRPKDPAVITEIDGVVKIGILKKGGIREIIVTGREGVKMTYMIPHGRHIVVQDGDYILAGDRITEGAIVHHDILKIKGSLKVAEYLVNEIQEVYRLQGVKINDKHIEIIVRQMLQKVKVEDPGDTNFLPDDIVNKSSFLEENENIMSKVVITDPADSKFRTKELVNKFNVDRVNERLKRSSSNEAQYRDAVPATFQPVLLGITQGALSTESFISAASFQETTRVLTDAAVEGKVDRLAGLKENVIIGNLIPAGTGMSKFSDLNLKSDEEEVEEETEDTRIEDAELAESEEKIN
jgi:DNA-directed RNA polymerase subunit beta'